MPPKQKPKKGQVPPSLFQRIWDFLFKPRDNRKPVTGCEPLKNAGTMHFRGVLGILIPLIMVWWRWDKDLPHKTVQIMWLTMAWFFFMQPVNVPVTGTVPIFVLPMLGIMSTSETCSSYFVDGIALMLLSGMVLLLLNNSGVDRRIILTILGSGDGCQFSAKRIVFKASTVAFFLSMFSNRLIVTSTILQYITPAYANVQSYTSKARGDSEPDFNEILYIVSNAVHTSSAIGSIAIMHSALATLTFRAIFSEAALDGEYPDIFNYLQYMCFAFPVALLCYIVNMLYHMTLINECVDLPMSGSSMNELRTSIRNLKQQIPKVPTCHEKQSVIYMVLSLLIFMFRWCDWLNMGWATFAREPSSPTLPGVKDATIAAAIAMLMHVIPKSCKWMNFFNYDKRSEMPPLKPESTILWWRYVDKNLNYGYIFLMGSGVALNRAIKLTGLGEMIAGHSGPYITELNWNVGILAVVLIAALLANIMSGVAACVSFLPFVIHMSFGAVSPWPSKMYVAALGVGIATSFGFMCPFLYTPAYYSHTVAKVPKVKMAKYSLLSVFICVFILWLALLWWAPYIWDPLDNGILPAPSPSDGPKPTEPPETTTAAPGF